MLAPSKEEVEQALHMLITSLKRMHGPEWDTDDEQLYRSEAAGCPPDVVRAVAIRLRREGGYRPAPVKIGEMVAPVEIIPSALETRRVREEEGRIAQSRQGKTNVFRDRARKRMADLLAKPAGPETVEDAINYNFAASRIPNLRDPLLDCPWLSVAERESFIREAWHKLTYGVSSGAGADRHDADPKWAGKGRHPIHVRRVASILAKERNRKFPGKSILAIDSGQTLLYDAIEVVADGDECGASDGNELRNEPGDNDDYIPDN